MAELVLERKEYPLTLVEWVRIISTLVGKKGKFAYKNGQLYTMKEDNAKK